MIPERMLELILWQEVFYTFNNDIEYNDFLTKYYDIEKINKRYLELEKEFLKPYAIDNTEKSE